MVADSVFQVLAQVTEKLFPSPSEDITSSDDSFALFLQQALLSKEGKSFLAPSEAQEITLTQEDLKLVEQLVAVLEEWTEEKGDFSEKLTKLVERLSQAQETELFDRLPLKEDEKEALKKEMEVLLKALEDVLPIREAKDKEEFLLESKDPVLRPEKKHEEKVLLPVFLPQDKVESTKLPSEEDLFPEIVSPEAFSLEEDTHPAVQQRTQPMPVERTERPSEEDPFPEIVPPEALAEKDQAKDVTTEKRLSLSAMPEKPMTPLIPEENLEEGKPLNAFPQAEENLKLPAKKLSTPENPQPKAQSEPADQKKVQQAQSLKRALQDVPKEMEVLPAEEAKQQVSQHKAEPNAAQKVSVERSAARLYFSVVQEAESDGKVPPLVQTSTPQEKTHHESVKPLKVAARQVTELLKKVVVSAKEQPVRLSKSLLISESQVQKNLIPEPSYKTQASPMKPLEEALISKMPSADTEPLLKHKTVKMDEAFVVLIPKQKGENTEKPALKTIEPLSLPSTKEVEEAFSHILRSVEFLRTSHGQEARLRLHPPELGEVHVRVTADKGLVDLQFRAESVQVKHLLEENAPRLVHALKEHGLELSSLSVNVNTSQGQGYSARAQEGFFQPASETFVGKEADSGVVQQAEPLEDLSSQDRVNLLA